MNFYCSLIIKTVRFRFFDIWRSRNYLLPDTVITNILLEDNGNSTFDFKKLTTGKSLQLHGVLEESGWLHFPGRQIGHLVAAASSFFGAK